MLATFNFFLRSSFLWVFCWWMQFLQYAMALKGRVLQARVRLEARFGPLTVLEISVHKPFAELSTAIF